MELRDVLIFFAAFTGAYVASSRLSERLIRWFRERRG